jgi:hypothetical protein
MNHLKIVKLGCAPVGICLRTVLKPIVNKRRRRGIFIELGNKITKLQRSGITLMSLLTELVFAR